MRKKAMSEREDLQELLRLLFTYDPATGLFSRAIKTSAQSYVGEIAGYTRPDGYVTIEIRGRKYGAHRLAWIYTYGAIPEGIEIDHKNLNHSDNRLENLRLATESQNKINSPRPLVNGYRGIYWHRNGWVARIKKDGKHFHLGKFDDPADGARAYDAKAREIHGEFAFLNFPNEGCQP
jgi:HNH endonuclease/AP2 domain